MGKSATLKLRKEGTAPCDQPELFDLEKACQHRYKVILDECWAAEKPEVRGPDRRWYQQIPTLCGGFIAMYCETGEVILHFYTPTARKKATAAYERFKHLEGVRLDDQHDGWETVLYFPATILMQVAEMVGARRRRKGRPLTEAQKAAFAEGRERGLAALRQGVVSLLSEPSEIHSGPEMGELGP
jgi:hypothetical protein